MEKTDFTIKLGQRIRELREEVGISQAELARRCGKDKQHMELIENGKTTCNSYFLYLISSVLEKEIDLISLND